MTGSEARTKIIDWVQEKEPSWTREQCETKAQTLIDEIKAEAEAIPPSDSEMRRRIKRRANIK